jgi:hypothetical protein
MKKLITLIKLMAIVCLGFTFFSCDEEETAVPIDKELYEMANSTDGFTWYKNSSAYLEKSDGSGHSQPYLRTRYNTIAATMLDPNGKILSGSTFPEGSLIVKELVDNDYQLDQYAILFKNSSDKYADSRGWVWGYIDADGKVRTSASQKGSSCKSCHLQSNNIDYMLMNKYFP